MSTVASTLAAVAAVMTVTTLAARCTARPSPLEQGHELWAQRLSRSALAALETATRDQTTAAEAHEAIGRISMFKGWQQEGVFPGWHDETEYREKAIAALKASLAADPTRASAAEALKEAESFGASPTVVPPAPPRPEVEELDAKIEAFRAAASAPSAELDALVEARIALQADPAPYVTAAQIMVERGDVARATDFANRGLAAAERFITENEGAYQMSGKAQGARARSRAQTLDILGTVAMRQRDLETARVHLEEAEGLSRGQDLMVQVHLGELASLGGSAERAEHHYLNALSLAGGPPPVRERARQALADIHAAKGEPVAFDAWLDEALTLRRRERREAALSSLIDRPLPDLALTDSDGRPYEIAALRGKVLLLNFFSSW